MNVRLFATKKINTVINLKIIYSTIQHCKKRLSKLFLSRGKLTLSRNLWGLFVDDETMKVDENSELGNIVMLSQRSGYLEGTCVGVLVLTFCVRKLNHLKVPLINCLVTIM